MEPAVVWINGAFGVGKTAVARAHMRRAGRVVGTHEILPETANGLVVGVSTRVTGRLGAWASWTNWPEEIGPTFAFGGRFNPARSGWKLRPGVLLGTWRKPEKGAP